MKDIEISFLLINFVIGFISDIILNVLTHLPSNYVKPLSSLKPYFSNKSVMKAALYAGITVLIIAAFIINLFKFLYGKSLPSTKKEYLVFLVITFACGFISDIIINRCDVFPLLKEYYRELGEGLWGGLAILFSVVVSLIILSL